MLPTMSAMPAEPTPSPLDPVQILAALPPGEERDAFRAAYRQAVAAAQEPQGFAALLRLLRLWSMRAAVVREPWYAEAREHARGPVDGGMLLDDFLRAR
jgi:hypothetical protein